MTTTTVPTVAERVQAGAAWLDEHEPGWVDRIHLDRLNIDSECQCILGQLHGSYKAAPPVQVAADDGGSHYGVLAWAIPLGFGMDWADCRDNGRELTKAWRELIAARQERSIVGAESVESATTALPREVFTDPERLVDELARIATAHGYEIDGRPSTRPALLLAARMVQHILIPGGAR